MKTLQDAMNRATKAASDVITGVSTHVLPEIQAQRLKICKGCAFRELSNQDINGKCGVCTCPLTNKTKVHLIAGLTTNECPKGHW